jgi:hypothetical protein
VDGFLNKGRKEKKDAYSAARVLHEKTGVPLLMHTREGACIIGGGKSTGFVPSVDITFPDDCSLVGAGDTLCGAFAIALAVKQRSDALIPENKKSRRLSYEDCLLLANIATGYRLAKINRTDEDDAREMEWYEAVGKVGELYGWASARTAKRSAEAALPDGVEFIDVEKNSAAFRGFSEMTSEALLGTVRDNCETDYWTARVAFEELCRNPKHMDALVELVKDSGRAGEIFGKKAVHLVAERRKVGVDALVKAISSMDDDTAFRVVSESVMGLENAKRAAEIIFGVMCTGKLVDSFADLMRHVAPPRFGEHVNGATKELEDKPDFIRGMNIFKKLVMGTGSLGKFVRGLLSEKGVDLDLIYNLGLLAQKEQSALVTGEINIVLSLPKHAGMDDKKWKSFTGEVKDFCEKRPMASLLKKEDPEARKKLMRRYNLSDEDFNNAIVLLLGETGWYWRHWPLSIVREYYEMFCVLLPKQARSIAQPGPQHQLLCLLAPPYTDDVRNLLLLYNESCKRSDSDFSIPGRLLESLTKDGMAHDFYRKVLAICLVGQLINPETGRYYKDRAAEIRTILKQQTEQPEAEVAGRAAAKCSHIERDHFMEPAHNRRMHKRRFEAASERMNRMKRIV